MQIKDQKLFPMTISIETAQNVNITYKPAGLLPRIIATVIDLCLLTGIFILCSMFNTILSPSSKYIYVGILLIILSCYHLFFEYFLNGRSIGKLTLNLRVVRTDGQKLSFWDCLLRWVFRLVDITATGGILAIICIILSKKMQRLGDLAAGTTVIQNNKQSSYFRLTTDEIPKNHEITFPQAALLSDKDFSVIKEVYKEIQKNENQKLSESLAKKIKELTGIQTEMKNSDFIRVILQDYTTLTK